MVDTEHRHHRDGFSDEELDLNNNETSNNCLARTDNPSEDPVPHEEPNRTSYEMTNRHRRGDDRTVVKKA